MKKIFFIMLFVLLSLVFANALDLYAITEANDYEITKESNSNYDSNSDIPVEDEDYEKLVPFQDYLIVEFGTAFDVEYKIKKKSELAVSDKKDNESIYEKVKFKVKTTDIGDTSITLNFKKNGTSLETILYVFSTEQKSYISTVSQSSARKIYFKEQYDKGNMKLEEYNDFVFGDIIEEHFDSEIENYQLSTSLYPLTATDIIQVKGKVMYEDNLGNRHNANKVRYIIYDRTSDDRDEITRGYTDSNGEYDVLLLNTENDGLDLTIRFEFENNDFKVKDSQALGLFTETYNYEHDYDDNSPDGTVLGINFIFPDDNDRTNAMHLYQAGIIGFKHLRDISGDTSFPFLDVEYPCTLSNTSFYDQYNIVINIHPDNGHSVYNNTPEDWDVLLHEFGHYVADLYDLTRLLAKSHMLSDNLSTRHGKSTGTRLAWQEGFANYYSISSQIAYSTEITVPGAGNFIYDNKNIETNTLYTFGEHNEWAIARILFDFADNSPSEYFGGFETDSVSFGDDGLFQKLLALAETDEIETFSEFMTFLYSTNPNDDFSPILERYGVIGSPNSPNNVTPLDSSTPTFDWSNGGDAEYSNNQFELKIFASNGTLLLSKSIYESTNTTLTTSEWDVLLDYNTDTYEWLIEEYQNYVPVIGSENLTGKYITSKLSFNRPAAVSITQNVPKYDSLQPLDNDWFQFTAPADGYYNIYTTGNTDTYGELSWRIVSDLSSNDIFRSDQSSGADSNFKMRVYIYEGMTIYIRVTPGQSSNSGDYYLVAEPSVC